MPESESIKSTKSHIKRVRELTEIVIHNLRKRSSNHDTSKLKSPEVEIFDKYTTQLKEVKYGSKEYKEYLEELKPALDHHYKYNSHHPEHYKDGIKDMSLLDILEMLIDWRAATERNKDGNIIDSINISQDRFKYSDDLKQILLNTVKELHWENKK